MEWLQLILRWTHVFAGILWVGTTYYFTWLDGRFNELEKAAGEAKKPDASNKQVWMVHSGGFYVVEKLTAPSVTPGKLHWFRWEAAITWFSGLLLFAMIYYHGGGLLVETEDPRISPRTALVASIVLLLLGWLVYDLLWISPLARHEMVGTLISYGLIVATTYGLFHFFASRAVGLQLGAMLGTIMTANVWMRILPAQRRMVAALAQGQAPDLAEARRAKLRSKHNTFIVVPVIYLMLNQHFPTTLKWTTVSLLVLAGWIVAKLVRRG
jgi:uncharacterized membrane protein